MLAPLVLAAAVAAPGYPAPPFLLDTLSGGTLGLTNLRGRPAIINVFATWCPPCNQEVPALVRAARANPGVRFVFVDEQETPRAVHRFAARYDIDATLGIDGGALEASYGVQSIPTTIAIDKHGIVRAIHRGPLAPADIERMIHDATH